MRVKQKYKNTLTRYLEWVASDFLRPKFGHDPTGLSAAEAMLQWETHGIQLPESSSEPDLLAKYVQGKTSRDFYITNWKEDCKDNHCLPEEFLYTLGFDEIEFRSVFGRIPDPIMVLNLGMTKEFMRLTEATTEPIILYMRAALRLKDNQKNDK